MQSGLGVSGELHGIHGLAALGDSGMLEAGEEGAYRAAPYAGISGAGPEYNCGGARLLCSSTSASRVRACGEA